eukprot:6673194-Prymnesium_polylepis.1
MPQLCRRVVNTEAYSSTERHSAAAAAIATCYELSYLCMPPYGILSASHANSCATIDVHMRKGH